MTMRRILLLLAIAGALLLGVHTRAATASVQLGWNASPSSGVAGYYIFYGTSSGNYSYQVPVYGVTNLTINGLTSGQTYYFAATSFTTNYTQSAYSPEVSVTAGAVAPSTGTGGVLSALTTKLPKGQFGFALSGTTGSQYIVQASTDLIHWVALQTNVAPFNFVDSNAAQFPRRFYRTVYTSN